MSDPLFYLQIVDRKDHVVRLPGGGRLEANLVELCVSAILPLVKENVIEICVEETKAYGVGWFKSEAKVEQAIRAGLNTVLSGPEAQQAIRNGITKVLMGLKQQTVSLVSPDLS